MHKFARINEPHWTRENPAKFDIAAIERRQNGALTVNEWRFRSPGRRWISAAKQHAKLRGFAVILRASGSLLLYLNLQGKIVQVTYPADVWRNAAA